MGLDVPHTTPPRQLLQTGPEGAWWQQTQNYHPALDPGSAVLAADTHKVVWRTLTPQWLLVASAQHLDPLGCGDNSCLEEPT